MIRLRPLHPSDVEEILVGQDDVLTQEITGRRWDEGRLIEFLGRCSRWREDGPIREFGAIVGRSGPLIGGGGLNRLAPGLARGQAAMTYWVLAPHREQGRGQQVASALVDKALADGRIDQLVLRIDARNEASRAVARGLGAAPTGRTERHPSDAHRSVDRWSLDLR